MVWSEDNPFFGSPFKFYIKNKDITFHWVGHSKIKPIGVDEFFKRKAFNNESDSTVNINEPTDKIVIAEYILE